MGRSGIGKRSANGRISSAPRAVGWKGAARSTFSITLPSPVEGPDGAEDVVAVSVCSLRAGRRIEIGQFYLRDRGVGKRWEWQAAGD